VHTLILLLTRPADLAVQIGCVLVLIGAFLLAVRKARRPDYRAIHRMERENSMTGYTAPVVRRGRGKR
jgi:membrane protein implicated in regulation of membrane protease activity